MGKRSGSPQLMKMGLMLAAVLFAAFVITQMTREGAKNRCPPGCVSRKTKTTAPQKATTTPPGELTATTPGSVA